MAEAEGATGAAREVAEGGQVALLEQGLWRRLGRATDLREAAEVWAPLMHAQLENAEVICVFLADPEGGRLRAVANWPTARLPGGLLLAAAEGAVESDRGVVRGGVGEGGALTGGLVAVAAPLTVEGQVRGAVGVEILPQRPDDLRRAMRRLQWGAAWMRDLLRREIAEDARSRYDRAIHALNAVISVAEREDIATATRAAATDLATRFNCDRVSIGFRPRFRTRVVAISHTANFAKNMALLRLIAAAMDEALDQRGVVLWPGDQAESPLASHRHEKLGRSQGTGHMVTVPLYAVDRFVGAITFERPSARPFTQDELEILEAVVTVLAPVLDEKRRNDRWLVARAAESLGRQFVRLAGPGYLLRKVVALAVAAAAAFFWFATGVDRVHSDALVEGAVQRTVAAPFDGFVAESFARAGDLVDEGEILVRLDDRELALERLQHVTELQSQRIEYDRALAAGDRAETQVRRSQMEQADAQIALIDRQLERTRLLAPFGGLVTAGDLSQSIGASVARGEPLLTVAPAGDYRLTMQVDERRIADVALGQAGTLIVTALPDQAFRFEVAKITPVAEYGSGATTFRVEGSFAASTAGLQPGMEGVAKIEVGEDRLITLWTRPLLDWARLWSWRWLNLG